MGNYKIVVLMAFMCLVTSNAYSNDNISSFKCKFSKYSVANFDNGGFKPKISNTDFEMTFADFNPKEDKASIIGNMGKSEVAMIVNLGGLHFIETPTDTMNVTSIFILNPMAQNKNNAEEIYAVHSRHNGAILSPSQYYGYCSGS